MSSLLKIFKCLILLGGISSFSLEAGANYYEEHARGWHWYEMLEQAEKEKNKEKAHLSPLDEVKAIRKEMDTKRAIAILEPTEENVYEYLLLQEHWTSRSEKFSKTWQLVLTKHPELNYNLQHPTSELAKRVEKDELLYKVKEAINYVSQKYGLFYFYKSDCPYCDKFSPILSDFSKRYGLHILPISLDGKPNKFFTNFKIDNGIANKWNVSHVPALFAVSPENDQVIPIAFGLASQIELQQKFVSLYDHIKEQNHAAMLSPNNMH